MKLSAADWEQALAFSGVRPVTAQLWAPAFAEEWQPDRFSQGMDDILDLLPQVLHETTGRAKDANFVGPLEQLEEQLSYSAERLVAVWPNRFPSIEAAAPFARNPQVLAEKVYGGRMGNSVPGWAWLYRGQGPIMFTSYDTMALLERITSGTPDYQDYTVVPEVLRQPRLGLAATRRWWEHEIPDGYLSDQVRIRRRVQGARVGLDHCIQLAECVRRAFA